MDSDTKPEPATPKIADGEKVHTLRLLNGSVTLLRSMLISQGWAKKPAQIRRGKKLRALLPKLDTPKDDDQVEEWGGSGEHIVEVPESLRKVGADCIGHFTAQGLLGGTDGADCLLTEFGVVDE